MKKETSFFICIYGILHLISVVAFENLSRRNTTIISQSSTYDKNFAYLANDGILKTTLDYCGYTQPGYSKAWLQVDLGKRFSLNYVKIYYRKKGNDFYDWKQYRFRQFYLDVSNFPAIETTTLQRTRCYTDNTTAPMLPPNIKEIPCKHTVRYIIVETTYDAPEDKYTGSMLEICEIEVYGCKAGSFGSNCSLCPDCSLCDIDNGTCLCDLQHYGSKCSWQCSANCEKGCDISTGTCYNCIKGKYLESCTEDCGAGCSSQCDRYSGNCTCRLGYKGLRCSECDLQYYGPNCSLECSPHCADGCDNEMGTCYSCIEGKFSESCTKACGAGCIFGCDQYTGNCTCKLGWRGNGCDECSSDYYGPNCSMKCSPYCADGCDNETGTCYSCIEGMFMESCNKACGESCVSGCDRYTGNCTCKPGYGGVRCSECQSKHYGPNCSLECNSYCVDGCNDETGTCTKCIEGKFTESCTESCNPGCVFGCDRYRGNCTCKSGWTGGLCDVQNFEYFNNSRSYSPVYILAAFFSFSLLVIALLLKRLFMRKNGMPETYLTPNYEEKRSEPEYTSGLTVPIYNIYNSVVEDIFYQELGQLRSSRVSYEQLRQPSIGEENN